MKQYHSIFNQVLGPVTPGPSSSNTSGPVKIADLCVQAFGEIPEKVMIEFPQDGLFRSTYITMKSDIAFINGLIGKGLDDPDFHKAYERAAETGVDIDFRISDFPCHPKYMETVKLSLKKGDKEYVFLAASTGGGTCLIYEFNGCETNLRGDQYEFLIFTEQRGAAKKTELIESLRKTVPAINNILCSGHGSCELITIQAGREISDDIIKKVNETGCIKLAMQLRPIYPVVLDSEKKPPFTTPDEMEEYCIKNRLALWQGVAAYESALSGWSENEVIEYSEKLMDIILDSAESGLKSDFDIKGIVKPTARTLAQNMKKNNPLSLGFLDEALPIALGIMEHSNAGKKIVCLPTGGSSGIIPAVIIAAAKQMGLAKADMAKALLVSGMIGVFMSRDNNFCGADSGCQAEVGCGTGMAAAALVQLRGGSVKEACDAAAMGLASLLGLLCDPVAGLVQVPCLLRNISCTAVAAASANAVMGGFEVIIPLEEVAAAMNDAAGKMPVAFKGNGEAGCCITPAGRRLRKEQERIWK